MPATRPRPTARRASTAPAGRARRPGSGCGSSCSPMPASSACPMPASRPSSTPSPTPRPRSAIIPSPRSTRKLGVVRHKGVEFVLADIPGLIEGAAEGAGIGDRFLGHVERTRVLLHLVDANVEDVADRLSHRPRRARSLWRRAGRQGRADRAQQGRHDRRRSWPRRSPPSCARESDARVFTVSGATGAGVDAVLDAIVDRIGHDPGGGDGARSRDGRRCEPPRPFSRSPAAPASSASHLLRAARAAGYQVRALTRGWRPAEDGIEWIEGALDRPDSLVAALRRRRRGRSTLPA